MLNTTPDNGEVTSAAGKQTSGLQQAGQAYSNYRQFDRDNYANQLSNRASLYQGLMNRMQSAYGGQGAPNVSQMGNNPMSFAQTTVGATHGSNAAGNGVDFYGGGGSNGQIDPNAYGLIGKMGLQGQGRYDGQDDNAGITPTLNQNGLPYVNGGINTNNVAPPSGPIAPAAQQQFSFAPRRP